MNAEGRQYIFIAKVLLYLFDWRYEMKIAAHQLRVNVKSLAAEARFIREEIRRSRDMESRSVLAAHRSCRLKTEARMAHLALAFTKGVPYRIVETNAKSPPDADRLVRKLKRFVPVRELDRVREWLEA